jgi:hypothetical protein
VSLACETRQEHEYRCRLSGVNLKVAVTNSYSNDARSVNAPYPGCKPLASCCFADSDASGTVTDWLSYLAIHFREFVLNDVERLNATI